MKPHCPLARYADQARKAGVNMLRAIHQLRRSVVACQACPLQANCTQRAAFNAEVDALIAEINEQWQFTESVNEPRQGHSKPGEKERLADGRG